MSTSPQDLQRMREANLGTEEADKKNRVDRIWKWFTPDDKQYAIAATNTRVEIGHGENRKTVIIYPMNPRQVVAAFGTLRKLMMPILYVLQRQEEGGKIPLGPLVEAFGENIEQLPELLYLIVSRGNSDITQEYIDEHLDFTFDTMAILKVFVEQNGLQKFFSPKGNAPSGNGVAATPQTPPPMEESQVPSTSVADTTDGNSTEFGTD